MSADFRRSRVLLVAEAQQMHRHGGGSAERHNEQRQRAPAPLGFWRAVKPVAGDMATLAMGEPVSHNSNHGRTKGVYIRVFGLGNLGSATVPL